MRAKFFVFWCMLIVFITGCGGHESSNNNEEEFSSVIPKVAVDAASPKVSNVEIEDLSEYFTGYNGCFVLYNTEADKYTIYNETKSDERISPCSTFKVVNTLIGLETKVVEDEDTVFKWDGTIYPIVSWNQDLDLASAIKYSAFWYYQKIASSAGESRIQEFLDSIGYGNNDISGGVTQFWQQSTLKISPKEQVDLLRRIYKNDVPFSKRNIDILKKIIVISNQEGVILSGKTGSGLVESKFVQEPGDEYISGWFIGFATLKDNVCFFATNINANSNATGTIAKEITLKILRDKGLY